MPDRLRSACRTLSVAVLAVLGSMLHAAPATAHKLNVWAEVDGTTIRGEAYFRGGSPAQEAKVEALAPDGTTLAETTTDAEGKFSLEARYRCDHRLVVNAGAGHGGEYKVGADELPGELPAHDGGERPAGPKPSPEVKTATETQPLPSEAAPRAPGEARLKKLIEAAVRDQVRPLERKLAEYQEKIRLSDVLGGIGYILGITGLLFFFLGARRKKSGPPAP